MSKQSRGRSPGGSVHSDGFTEAAESALLSDGSGASRDVGNSSDEVEQGAKASNTAPNSYNSGLFFQPLRWGIDSLYLSYQGELSNETEARLQELKNIAQSPQEHQQVFAQITSNGHIFEVWDKGTKYFPYLLSDGAFRIQLSRPGSKMPMAYVQVSSGYLSHTTPLEVEKELRAVIGELGEIQEAVNTSRIDLYVDFASKTRMDSWGRHAWRTRASSINTYSEGKLFTGWMIGAGGAISCRLYDKTQEIKKSHKGYLKELWSKAGWDGESPVWRLEFQLRRELLDQLGVAPLDMALRYLTGLWSYACMEWLQLTLPDPDDKNRSRWPTHPLWLALSSIDWETNGGPLLKRFSYDRAPSDDWVCRTAFSSLTTLMAKQNIYDFSEGMQKLGMEVYNFYSNRTIFEGVPFDQFVTEKVMAKGRKFNTISNLDEIPNEDRIRSELDEAAAEYRRQSGGE